MEDDFTHAQHVAEKVECHLKSMARSMHVMGGYGVLLNKADRQPVSWLLKC